MAASDKKMDLKSILLQILNQEMTDSQSDTLTGISQANVNGSDSEVTGKSSGHIAEDDQKSIIKEATKEIFEEIDRLKAKYTKHGNKKSSSEDDESEITKLEDSENVNGDHENAGNIGDKDYAIQVMKLNNAAKELFILRLKLAEEYKIDEEDLHRLSEEDIKRPKIPEKWSRVNRLLEILLGIESDLQEDEKSKENERALERDDEMLKLIALQAPRIRGYFGTDNTKYGKNGLARPALRDWHTKGCSDFKDPCLGWFPDCCESGKIGKIEFNMCCSFSNYNLKGKDKLSGICIPNAYGKGQCVQRRP